MTQYKGCISCGESVADDNMEYDEVCQEMHPNQHHSCFWSLSKKRGR